MGKFGVIQKWCSVLVWTHKILAGGPLFWSTYTHTHDRLDKLRSALAEAQLKMQRQKTRNNQWNARIYLKSYVTTNQLNILLKSKHNDPNYKKKYSNNKVVQFSISNWHKFWHYLFSDFSWRVATLLFFVPSSHSESPPSKSQNGINKIYLTAFLLLIHNMC